MVPWRNRRPANRLYGTSLGTEKQSGLLANPETGWGRGDLHPHALFGAPDPRAGGCCSNLQSPDSFEIAASRATYAFRVFARRIAERNRQGTVGVPLNSCSQIRTTFQPRARNSEETRRSRFRLRASLDRQYPLFSAGRAQWIRQPCQKQPSTKTAIRREGKQKSGVPVMGRCRLQPTVRAARMSRMSASSVLRFPRARTRDMISERSRFVNASVIDWLHPVLVGHSRLWRASELSKSDAREMLKSLGLGEKGLP